MGADIYLQSVYDAQRAEHRVEELYRRFIQLQQTNAKEPERDAARKAWLDADNKASAGSYFRDSYNESNLAWLFGLSYWQESKNTVEGVLPVERLRVWRDTFVVGDRSGLRPLPALVEAAIQNAIDNQAKAPGAQDRTKPELTLNDGETVEQVIDYFEEKRRRFVALLERAIALDEGLRWSV